MVRERGLGYVDVIAFVMAGCVMMGGGIQM